MTAAIRPGSFTRTCAISRPRALTASSACANGRTPAATSAAYSPRLWPITRSGRYPRSASSRVSARSTARMAGCRTPVSRSACSARATAAASSGSGKTQSDRRRSRIGCMTASASAKVSRTDRLRLAQRAEHVDVLRALAGVEEGHAAGGSPRAEDPHAAQRLPQPRLVGGEGRQCLSGPDWPARPCRRTRCRCARPGVRRLGGGRVRPASARPPPRLARGARPRRALRARRRSGRAADGPRPAARPARVSGYEDRGGRGRAGSRRGRRPGERAVSSICVDLVCGRLSSSMGGAAALRCGPRDARRHATRGGRCARRQRVSFFAGARVPLLTHSQLSCRLALAGSRFKSGVSAIERAVRVARTTIFRPAAPALGGRRKNRRSCLGTKARAPVREPLTRCVTSAGRRARSRRGSGGGRASRRCPSDRPTPRRSRGSRAGTAACRTATRASPSLRSGT